MAKQLLPVIDSNGNFSHRRRKWVLKQETAALGAFRDGVFVFYRERQPGDGVVYGSPGNRAVGLLDRLWDRQPDTREFVIDPSYWDGRACMRFWGDQSSHGRATVRR